MDKVKGSDLPQAQEADGADEKVQGEGDYRSDRRYRKQVQHFLAHNDVEALARAAAPDDDNVAKELETAERRGREGPGKSGTPSA
jgi:hypothetical protein